MQTIQTYGQPRFAAYREMGGKYMTANRPMTRAEFRAELAKDSNAAADEEEAADFLRAGVAAYCRDNPAMVD